MPAEYLSTYKRQGAGRQNGNSSDKELIDISSDDEQTKTYTAPPTKPVREPMEVETTQVAKRPHLCPSVEPSRSIPQQVLLFT